jgi:hypothetical protein
MGAGTAPRAGGETGVGADLHLQLSFFAGMITLCHRFMIGHVVRAVQMGSAADPAELPHLRPFHLASVDCSRGWAKESRDNRSRSIAKYLRKLEFTLLQREIVAGVTPESNQHLCVVVAQKALKQAVRLLLQYGTLDDLLLFLALASRPLHFSGTIGNQRSALLRIRPFCRHRVVQLQWMTAEIQGRFGNMMS